MKFNKRKVLIAPLDWGLGHATRCIPLIKAFLARDWEVVIAADGAIEKLLRQEFPQVAFLKLEGYGVTYSAGKWTMPFKMALQVPKILGAIKKEQRWLQTNIQSLQPDLIISDNRYGLYSANVPCVFITHQLKIKAPFAWMERRIQELNYRFISRFTECWVPDEELNGLAGELSHPTELHPFPLRYLGWLSRFRRMMTPVKYQYAFLLSGPEPQRSLLEKKILNSLSALRGNILIVRGKPGDEPAPGLHENVTIVNHLEGREMEQALNAAAIVVSRAGYTTIMELAALNKRSVLIPTPGQTEQEYLGDYLLARRWAMKAGQADLDLPRLLENAANFPFTPFPVAEILLEEVLDAFLETYFKPVPATSFAAS